MFPKLLSVFSIFLNLDHHRRRGIAEMIEAIADYARLLLEPSRPSRSVQEADLPGDKDSEAFN